MKNIFAVSGSLRSGSVNHRLLHILAKYLDGEVDYTIYDELALIPPFNPDHNHASPPGAVLKLRACIENAAALIICTPEYAYGVPGQLKNALDWMVSSGSISGKPTALVTAGRN